MCWLLCPVISRNMVSAGVAIVCARNETFLPCAVQTASYPIATHFSFTITVNGIVWASPRQAPSRRQLDRAGALGRVAQITERCSQYRDCESQQLRTLEILTVKFGKGTVKSENGTLENWTYVQKTGRLCVISDLSTIQIGIDGNESGCGFRRLNLLNRPSRGNAAATESSSAVT